MVIDLYSLMAPGLASGHEHGPCLNQEHPQEDDTITRHTCHGGGLCPPCALLWSSAAFELEVDVLQGLYTAIVVTIWLHPLDTRCNCVIQAYHMECTLPHLPPDRHLAEIVLFSTGSRFLPQAIFWYVDRTQMHNIYIYIYREREREREILS